MLVPDPHFSLNSCVLCLTLSPYRTFENPACQASLDNFRTVHSSWPHYLFHRPSFNMIAYFCKSAGGKIISEEGLSLSLRPFAWLSWAYPGKSSFWLKQNQLIWDLNSIWKFLHLCHILLFSSKGRSLGRPWIMELPSSACQVIKYVKSSVQYLMYTKSSINVNTSHLSIFLKSLLEPQSQCPEGCGTQWGKFHWRGGGSKGVCHHLAKGESDTLTYKCMLHSLGKSGERNC